MLERAVLNVLEKSFSGSGNLAVRAEQHGGTFRLDQGEPNGTTATWSIPVPVPAQ